MKASVTNNKNAIPRLKFLIEKSEALVGKVEPALSAFKEMKLISTRMGSRLLSQNSIREQIYAGHQQDVARIQQIRESINEIQDVPQGVKNFLENEIEEVSKKAVQISGCLQPGGRRKRAANSNCGTLDGEQENEISPITTISDIERTMNEFSSYRRLINRKLERATETLTNLLKTNMDNTSQEGISKAISDLQEIIQESKVKFDQQRSQLSLMVEDIKLHRRRLNQLNMEKLNLLEENIEFILLRLKNNPLLREAELIIRNAKEETARLSGCLGQGMRRKRSAKANSNCGTLPTEDEQENEISPITTIDDIYHMMSKISEKKMEINSKLREAVMTMIALLEANMNDISHDGASQAVLNLKKIIEQSKVDFDQQRLQISSLMEDIKLLFHLNQLNVEDLNELELVMENLAKNPSLNHAELVMHQVEDAIGMFNEIKKIKEKLNPELLKDYDNKKVNDIIDSELGQIEEMREAFINVVEKIYRISDIAKKRIKNKFNQEIQRVNKKVSDIQSFASLLSQIERFESQKNKLREEIGKISQEVIISTKSLHDFSKDFTDMTDRLIEEFGKSELDANLLENAPDFIKEKVQGFKNGIDHLKKIKAENDVTSYSVNDLTKSVQDYNIGGIEKNDLTKSVLTYRELGIVKYLTENKVNINVIGSNGQTLLHSAAIIGNEPMVSSLLKKGAIFNVKDHDGKTPKDLSQNPSITNLLQVVGSAFDHVRENNVEELSSLMVKLEYCDILINVRDESGYTLLHSAIAQKQTNKEDQVKIINLLIDNGIDIHSQDLSGHSPLYIAIKNKEEKIINVLLEKGARVDYATIEFAKQSSDEAIIEEVVEKLEQNNLDEFMSNVGSCSSSSSRAKRAVDDCISWEDIDEFNEEESKPRNPEEIKINSEKFISYIQNVPEEKRSALIKLADKVGEERVMGKFQGAVNKLTSNQRVMNHLNKIGRISSIGMHGMMGKAVLGAFLRGDYKDVAINLGFIAFPFGVKAGETLSLKGLEFAEKFALARGFRLASVAKPLFAQSIRLSSSFLARGTSAFIAYDLYDQVKKYENGDKDALVGIVGDSIYLGIDAAEIGIEVAEAFGVLEGVSSVTGPIGAGIGLVIFVGTDIYFAVKRVDKIDQVIHLTGWEKFKEGSRAFIGMNPEGYIEELMDEKQANNQLVKQALEFLKNNTSIERYVFPTGKSVVDSCTTIESKRYVCISGFDGCDAVPRYTEKCTNKIQYDSDSEVRFGKKSTRIKWKRSKPDNPGEGELFCLPGVKKRHTIRKFTQLFDGTRVFLPSADQEMYEPVSSNGAYLCENAIGVKKSSIDETGSTLINLGKGNDIAVGFKDTPNIFTAEDGEKNFYGGKKNDLFILKGSNVVGQFNGGKGIDTIDFGNFISGKALEVDLNRQYVRHPDIADNVLRIVNFENVLGRKNGTDKILTACETEHIDGRGGKNDNERDLIIIDNKENCSYKTQIVVGPNTDVENYESSGTFTYIVNSGQGQARINLFEAAQHNFVFNYSLSDVESINKTQNRVTFSLSDSSAESRFNITVLEPIAATRNILYSFNDNSKVILGEKNIFVLQKTNRSVSEVISSALPIVNRLGVYFSVQSGNESIVIGHKNNDVMENNFDVKTHLIGGDGENVYVINPGNETINTQKLPLPEVVIYNLDRENQGIDTINFRDLLKKLDDKLKDKLKDNLKYQVEQSGNDLLLILQTHVDKAVGVEDARVSDARYRHVEFKTNDYDVITVKLKDGIFWHDRAHVIIDKVPMRIKQDHSLEYSELWNLNPLSLNFSKEHKFIYISTHDIMKNQEINIDREAGEYKLLSNKNDLVINYDSEYSVILEGFFTNLVMQTLKINFSDKKVNLREIDKSNITELNDVRNVHKKRIDTILNEFKDKIEAENVTAINNSTETHLSQIPHSRQKRYVKISRKIGGFLPLYQEQAILLAPKKNDMAEGLNSPLGKDELSQINKPSLKINEENVASTGSRPSSWINIAASAFAKVIAGAANGVARLISFPVNTSSLPLNPSQKENFQKNSNFHKIRKPGGQYIAQFNSGVLTQNISLGLYFFKNFLDAKYPLPKWQSIDEKEALAYVLNITEEFGKRFSTIPNVPAEEIDLAEVQSKIFKAVMSGNSGKIPKILLSYVKEISTTLAPDEAKDLLAAFQDIVAAQDNHPTTSLSNVSLSEGQTKHL